MKPAIVTSPWVLHRFQVNKDVAQAMRTKHPWIYRRQCSSALQALPIGCLVRVVGPKNEFLGIGLHDPLSIVAIRMFSFVDVAIDSQYFYDRLLAKYKERYEEAKTQNTNAFRWIHGEVDGFGGVNIDVYQNTAVAVFYLENWQHYLLDVLQALSDELKLEHFYFRLPHGQTEGLKSGDLYDCKSRSVIPAAEPVWFQEGSHEYPAYVVTGQKTGFYLDLREVRLCLQKLDLNNKRVLNLFSGSGVLSGLMEKQGADFVVSVEASAKCQQQFGVLQQAWGLSAQKHEWLNEDVWDYLKSEKFLKGKNFDVIILDPPALAKSHAAQENLNRIWSGLVEKCLAKLNVGGQLFTICCTDRISEMEHGLWTKEVATLENINLVCVQKIKQPFDHPAHPKLKERDYFHAYQWERKALR